MLFFKNLEFLLCRIKTFDEKQKNIRYNFTVYITIKNKAHRQHNVDDVL